MTKKEQPEQRIIAFVLEQSGDFQLQDLLDVIEPASPGKRGISKRDLLNILNRNGLVFSKYGKTAKPPGTFTPRHIYFKNARFMVSPRPEEVAGGILIPGHRYIPFFNPRMNPWECVLLTESGAEVPRTVISRSFGSLIMHYTLFGAENIGNFLVMDQESNAQALGCTGLTDNTQVNITVFDCTDLYRQWNFTPGDSIICEVKDWAAGVYAVGYISYEKRRALMDRSMKWIAALEKGFRKAFDIFGVKMDIEEQISYAYYYAGKEILQEPPIHLGGFLDISDKVHLVPFGIESKLWYEKEFTISRIFADSDQAPKKRGFAGFLENLSAPCSDIEVEAFTLDELFRHKGTVDRGRDGQRFDSVIKRIFGDNIRFMTPEQEHELFGYFQKLWKKSAKSYNYFKDQAPGKARNMLLEILEDYYGWFRDLNEMAVSPEEIPVQLLTSIGQMYNTLTNYLMILNRYDAADQPQINQLLEFLPAVSSTLESLTQSVVEHIQAGRKHSGNSKLRLVRPSDEEQGPMERREPKYIFVFRISFKYIRPPIWRSVQVPGSFTLGDFHQVIQDAMGWDDAHLHEFSINHINYGSMPEDGFQDLDMELENEDAYTLDTLGLAEKQRFVYTYDFGDDWEHQILVSKVLPVEEFSEEDKRTPRCLKGKRACPPEDCGGVFGYEEVMEALAAPHKKKYRELLNWAGGFDPEYFDIHKVNRLFRLNGNAESDDI
jgi:hypothetical protein